MPNIFRITIAAIFLLVVFPMSALAAGVGFAPATGIWFSRTSFAPGETVRVYSVVINNVYAGLDGVVGFYDNGRQIDTVEIKNLVKESAREISIAWKPAAGRHAITAKFIRAVAYDEVGVSREVSLADITSAAGEPLMIGGAPLSPAGPVSDGSDNGLVAGIKVAVADQAGQLIITAASGTGYGLGAASQAASAAGGRSQPDGDLFATNRAALVRAQQVMTTITTTASQAASIAAKTKVLTDKGRDYFDRGRAYWDQLAPYLEKAKPWWLSISNDNDPRRVGLIVLGVVIFWWLLRRRRRRRWYDDN